MSAKNLFASVFQVQVQGQVNPQLDADLLEVVVEDNLFLPDMFTVRLLDPKQQWVDSPLLEIGSKVKISTRPPGLQAKAPKKFETLFIGEITSLEPEFTSGNAPIMQVRGYDFSHRLHQGKQTRSFLKTTDSEVAQKIAREVGLSAKVDTTQPIHEQITQNNQTNMDFLQGLAQRNGYQLYVEEDTLYFRRGDQTQEGEDPPTVEWGVNLSDFQPRIAAVHQVKEVIVRGWDPQAKREIIGRANKQNSYPDIPGVDQISKAYPGTEQLVVSRPIKTQEEATILAQSILDEMAGSFVKAEGAALGDPRIKSGKKIKVSRLGKRFSGEYFVTLSTHHYTLERGYTTAFSISGRQAETISSLLVGANKGSVSGDGIRIGLVTQNKDPEGLGRVKVRYPTVDEADESAWARIAAPMAGSSRGFYFVPEINDEVLVGFEQGDVHRPYILGALWNGKDKPPISDAVGADGQVNKRVIYTRSGHQIILDDSSGSEKITIKAVGKGDVLIEAAGDVTVTSKGKVKIDASSGISMDSSSDVSITASGQISIKGSKISFN